MADRPEPKVQFYPVLHLMTGPPGLSRNGGIWKKLKTHLRAAARPARFMVQALHFTSYELSDRAWHAWFEPWYGVPRIQAELDTTFGERRDLFLDSGGYQLLHSQQVDLSRWGMELSREDILELQLKFAPTRIASLDAPLDPRSRGNDLRRLTTFSLENAAWLALQDLGSGPGAPLPYLVVHGRTPAEILRYLSRLENRLTRRVLRAGRYSIALGSQVPLSGSPDTVVANALTVLRWMDSCCSIATPLHIFGVGDSIAGEVWRSGKPGRDLSYDNSTYIQNAFRLRTFNSSKGTYEPFNPSASISCRCSACGELNKLGGSFVADLMSSPAYVPAYLDGERINRSDILALVALHNLGGWRKRLTRSPSRTQRKGLQREIRTPEPSRSDYSFPLKSFEAVGENLLLLPCSRIRPYGQSPSHRRVINHLESLGLHPASDFDRITLSGYFGPVHWKDEGLRPVMSYDFRLTPLVDPGHLRELRFRTASVLNVIRNRYESMVAYLRSPSYEAAFGNVVRSFGVKTTRDVAEVGRALGG